MNKIQSRLLNACGQIGNLRLSAELLRDDPRFENIAHPTLVRWINHPNPSPNLTRKMERAFQILSANSKNSKPKLKKPQRELLRKALRDIENVRRTIKALLKVFT
jgi:hypothetical protein